MAHAFFTSNALREKCPNMELFLIGFFPVFGLNTGRYEPEITPYLDAFRKVTDFFNSASVLLNISMN